MDPGGSRPGTNESKTFQRSKRAAKLRPSSRLLAIVVLCKSHTGIFPRGKAMARDSCDMSRHRGPVDSGQRKET
jgi:hypothetical protein